MPTICSVGLVADLPAATEMVVRPSGDPNEPGPEPTALPQGTYHCMLQSMEAKQVTEPQRSKITKWGKLVQETSQGYAYWAIQLEYMPTTVFGKAETTVRALIRNNRVHLWLYVGSNEIVP